MAAAHVTGGEDAFDASLEFAVVSLHIGACVEVETEFFSDGGLWPEKAHCEEDEIGFEYALAAVDLFRDEAAVFTGPFDVVDMDCLDVTVGIAGKAAGADQILARILTLNRFGLFLAVVHLVSFRPFWPRIVGRTLGGWLRHDL